MIKRMMIVVGVLAACVCAEQVVERVESAAVRKAQRTYNAEYVRIEQWYAKQVAELARQKVSKVAVARKKFVSVIDSAIEDAMKSRDLDEVKVLDALKTAVESGESVVTIPRNAVEYAGHWYVVVSQKMTQQEAAAKCATVGGKLVRIETVKEQAFVKRLVTAKGRYQHYWMDGSDAEVEGQWKFSDGSAIRYLNWSDGQPNNVGGSEHGLVFQRSNGKWLDAKQSHECGFICEIVLAGEDDDR